MNMHHQNMMRQQSMQRQQQQFQQQQSFQRNMQFQQQQRQNMDRMHQNNMRIHRENMQRGQDSICRGQEQHRRAMDDHRRRMDESKRQMDFNRRMHDQHHRAVQSHRPASHTPHVVGGGGGGGGIRIEVGDEVVYAREGDYDGGYDQQVYDQQYQPIGLTSDAMFCMTWLGLSITGFVFFIIGISFVGEPVLASVGWPFLIIGSFMLGFVAYKYWKHQQSNAALEAAQAEPDTSDYVPPTAPHAVKPSAPPAADRKPSEPPTYEQANTADPDEAKAEPGTEKVVPKTKIDPTWK